MKYLIFLLAAFNLYAQDWTTKFERSGFLETARYEESMDYFRRLAESSEYARFFSIGKSPQGKDINCIILSKDKAFSPEAAKAAGKPIVLIINGIHSGEIEGKDASMMLLRDILINKSKVHLLDNTIIMVIPIFSVDGHERFRAYNRINQNGPKEMGWRTTAQNLNLNRDWMKADAPEMRHLLKLFSAWLPDFFVDTHTTDGADYQYTVTYGIEKFRNIYSETRQWIKSDFIPYFEKSVQDSGYLIAPYVGFKDDSLEKGIVDWAASPRFSQGYAAIQNRPGLLVETHMMKPYKDRVFSTEAVLNAVLNYINRFPSELIALNKKADEGSVKQYAVDKEWFPLNFKAADNPNAEFLFKGFKAVKEYSPISGSMKTVYTDEKFDMLVPYYNDAPVTDSVKAPKEYIIPAEWTDVIELLKLHGVTMHQTAGEQVRLVTRYKFKDVQYPASSYEGRQRLAFGYTAYTDSALVPKGSYIIPAAQRAVRVIMQLLEPLGNDSFAKWGFFNTVMEQKEYFEDYVMEKTAAEMLKNNPMLQLEFEQKLKDDPGFRDSPYQRLNFFYERSPYYDEKYMIYPVMRSE